MGFQEPRIRAGHTELGSHKALRGLHKVQPSCPLLAELCDGPQSCGGEPLASICYQLSYPTHGVLCRKSWAECYGVGEHTAP